MTGSQTWHGPIDLIQMQIFGLPRHGEEKTPASGCQTFKCYFNSSNCLLTHISRCWIQYNQRETYWFETNFCFNMNNIHDIVWPFAHLVVSVAKVFPCNIHDEGLAWKQDHRLLRIVEMGQKMPMHVPVLLFILHIWHQRWDEVASDVIIEPPFWAWIKHAKCNRSNDGQIFNINSKKNMNFVTSCIIFCIPLRWLWMAKLPLLNSSLGAAFMGVIGGWSPWISHASTSPQQKSKVLLATTSLSALSAVPTSRPVLGFRICPCLKRWLTVFPHASVVCSYRLPESPL